MEAAVRPGRRRRRAKRRQEQLVGEAAAFVDADAILRSTDLHGLTQIVRRGYVTALEVGFALYRIKTAGLYKQTHGSWEAWCADNCQTSRRHADRQIAAMRVFVESTGPIGSGRVVLPERAARELAKVEPVRRQLILDDAAEIRETSGRSGPPAAADIAEARKRRHPAGARSEDSNERYTPGDIIEDAREVMGSIDFDPASNSTANKTVKAKVFYTIEDDGLTKEWHGNGWNNWPFSLGNMPRFTAKLFDELAAKRTKQAIVLTNADTGAGWFQQLGGRADSVCLPRGRINFVGAPKGNWLSQAFFYFGRRVKSFEKVFGARGLIVRPSEVV
jgi:hypothetical protein